MELIADGLAPRFRFCGDADMNNNRPDRATILIIDGDPLTLTAVAAALHLSGHECHCARDCEAAIKAARGLTLDLIICDMHVDDDSGLELIQEIKLEPDMRDVPVIFVSSTQMPDMVRRAHDAGGAYYLRKPFDPEVLLELVDKALWMPHLVNTQIRHARPLAGPARRAIDA
jgi:putative two-component system response regulator